MYGGNSINGPQCDLWSFNLINQMWTFIKYVFDFNPLLTFTYNAYTRNNIQYLCIFGGINNNFLSGNLHILNIIDLTWESINQTSLMPDAVQQPSVVYFNDYIYVLGGYRSNSFFNRSAGCFYRYSLIQDKWENITNDSYSLIPISCPTLIYQDLLYVIFGTYTFANSNLIFRVNLTDENWNWELINVENAYARWGFMLNGEDNKFYAFGGGEFYSYNDLNLFIFKKDCNSATDTCIAISSIISNYLYPPPRSNHALIVINSLLYVFGGKGSDGFYSDMWSFDTSQEIWNSVNQQGTIPSERHLFAYDGFGNTLAIFGGEDSSGLKNDLYIFNSVTSVWSYITPLSSSILSGRKGACAVINLPYIYIYGGITLSGTSNELWQFSFRSSEFTLLSTSPLGYAYINCQIVNQFFNIYLGRNSENYSPKTIKMYDLNTNKWLADKEISFPIGGIQSIAININGYFVCYGGTDDYSEAYSNLIVVSSNYSDFATVNFTPYNMAFAYYNSYLYISGGGSINLYQQIAPNSYNPFFGRVDVNYTFLETVIPCSPGTQGQGNICVSCAVGTYSDTFSNDPCTHCRPGTYRNITGANSQRQCLFCPQNTFNNNFGSSLCFDCTRNEYCPIGSINAQPALNFSYLQSIQPLNYNNHQKSSLISQSQLIITIITISASVILIVVFAEKIKQIDIYKQNHLYEYNIPMTLIQTTIGGAFTLLFYACAVILICSGALTYFLDNINEIKALQPLVILETNTKHFYAFIAIEISLIQYLDSCEKSNGLINLNVSGIVQANLSSNESFDYSKTSDHTCILTYNCNNCYIEPGAFIQAVSTENSSFASAISVSVNSSSSIPGSNSYFQSGVIADDQKVFAGSIATTFSFSVTPSYFESDSSIYPSSDTGYHISQDAPPVSGSQYGTSDLETISNILILVNLPLSAFGLYTMRLTIQGIFVLISSLLGTISGALGAIRFAMSFSEQKYLKYQNNHSGKDTITHILRRNLRLKQNLSKACIFENGTLTLKGCNEITDSHFIKANSKLNVLVKV